MSAGSPKRGAASSRGGIATPAIVPPQVVSDRSILDSAIGFISDVTLAHQPQTDPKHSITWARFETLTDISDPRYGADWELEGNVAPPLLLALGLGLGYQVWAIPANGEAIEVLSSRRNVMLAFRVLPSPTTHNDDGDSLCDAYAEKRPLMAICESTPLATSSPQLCAVNFVSLRTAIQVKTIKFKNPVLDIVANRSSVVITFHERIAVFSAHTLEDHLSITTCYPSPGISPNPIALGQRWLAYAEQRLIQSKRSGGGCDGEGVTSYTATVLNAAKSFGKGLRELGEQVAAGLTGSTGSINSKNSSPDSTASGGDPKQPGVITIMDIKHPVKAVSPTTGTPITADGSDPFIVHFVAHSEAVVAMEFDNSGMLLATADRRGHNFHVFRIQPHPVGSSLAAVHHLYVLHRGDTTAKVQNITFSLDSRWIAISTLRGTTHVFPITPYGGPIGVRTHTSLHVVNKLSRFHRSAGLTADGRSNSPVSHSEAFCQPLSPYHNPTLPPYSRPTVVTPLAQLRQPFALNSPPGHAMTMTTPPSKDTQRQRLSSLSEDNGRSLIVCAMFAKSRAELLNPPNATRETAHRIQRKAVDCLFVMAGHGALIQYDLNTKHASNVAKEKICDETPIELEVEARAQWCLGRKDGAQEIMPPLSADNWLLRESHASSQLAQEADGSRTSTKADEQHCDNSWLSQVEIMTHAGPHRRLWMGPQFVFKTYNTPSGGNLNHIETEAVEVGVTASTATARLERTSPLNMPPTGHTAVPVVIESGSYSSIEQSPKLMERFRHEPLDMEFSSNHDEARLREDLADAMRELPTFSASLKDSGFGSPRAVPAILGDISYESCPNIDSLKAVPIEKFVNPLGTVTTVKPGVSGVSIDLLDEVVAQLAAEERIIHRNWDESQFRPVVTIFCDEKTQALAEEDTFRQIDDTLRPVEVIGNKLIVPVISKERNEELSKREGQKKSTAKTIIGDTKMKCARREEEQRETNKDDTNNIINDQKKVQIFTKNKKKNTDKSLEKVKEEISEIEKETLIKSDKSDSAHYVEGNLCQGDSILDGKKENATIMTKSENSSERIMKNLEDNTGSETICEQSSKDNDAVEVKERKEPEKKVESKKEKKRMLRKLEASKKMDQNDRNNVKEVTATTNDAKRTSREENNAREIDDEGTTTVDDAGTLFMEAKSDRLTEEYIKSDDLSCEKMTDVVEDMTIDLKVQVETENTEKTEESPDSCAAQLKENSSKKKPSEGERRLREEDTKGSAKCERNVSKLKIIESTSEPDKVNIKKKKQKRTKIERNSDELMEETTMADSITSSKISTTTLETDADQLALPSLMSLSKLMEKEVNSIADNEQKKGHVWKSRDKDEAEVEEQKPARELKDTKNRKEIIERPSEILPASGVFELSKDSCPQEDCDGATVSEPAQSSAELSIDVVRSSLGGDMVVDVDVLLPKDNVKDESIVERLPAVVEKLSSKAMKLKRTSTKVSPDKDVVDAVASVRDDHIATESDHLTTKQQPTEVHIKTEEGSEKEVDQLERDATDCTDLTLAALKTEKSQSKATKKNVVTASASEALHAMPLPPLSAVDRKKTKKTKAETKTKLPLSVITEQPKRTSAKELNDLFEELIKDVEAPAVQEEEKTLQDDEPNMKAERKTDVEAKKTIETMMTRTAPPSPPPPPPPPPPPSSSSSSAWNLLSGAEMISRNLEVTKKVPERAVFQESSYKQFEAASLQPQNENASKDDTVAVRTPFVALTTLKSLDALPPLPMLEPLEIITMEAAAAASTKFSDNVSLINFESPLDDIEPTTFNSSCHDASVVIDLYKDECTLPLHEKNNSSSPISSGSDEIIIMEKETNNNKNNNKKLQRRKKQQLEMISKQQQVQQQQSRHQQQQQQHQPLPHETPCNPQQYQQQPPPPPPPPQQQQHDDDEELRPLISMSESQLESCDDIVGLDVVSSTTILLQPTINSIQMDDETTTTTTTTTTDSEGAMPATTTTTSDENYHHHHHHHHHNIGSSIIIASSTSSSMNSIKLKTKKLEHKINLMAAIEAATSSSTSSAEGSGCEDPDANNFVRGCPPSTHCNEIMNMNMNMNLSGSVGITTSAAAASSSSSSSSAATTTTTAVSMLKATGGPGTATNIVPYVPMLSQPSVMKKKTKRRRR